ncbi:hypothetical protein GCM10022251_45190 [Phytohabitans flavus]|uniref:ABC transporter permease n=1 Tax=Phytohabitans flavus TaxID=1076124 RepID=A0A6F8XT93_9ACTN|nr:hypothetical protein [Phytohabitans flavus]BCB77040.1 hypothetical protein Pflav_034500 [Phytohabitans flavus]
MTALIRLRLVAFLRTGRALAPLLSVLVVLGVIYGGGQAQAAEAYGFSAAVLFPVVAWQTQILFNVEPDTQRQLSTVAVGGLGREIVAGLLTALVPAFALVAIALALPWALGGITGPQRPGDPSLASGVVAGVWAHLLLVPPALLLGAVASRAAVGNAARGLAVLAGCTVLAFAVGTKDSPVPWLAPPLLPTARATVDGLAAGPLAVQTAFAAAWAAVALVGYVTLRRRNA